MHGPLGGGKPVGLTIFVGQKGAKRQKLAVRARIGVFGINALGVVLHPASEAGKLVVWNNDVGSWQLVAGLYHAFRQTWHILWQYGLDMTLGEKSAMRRAADLARQLNVAVLATGPGTTVEEMRRTTRVAIQEAAELLGERPRKPTKAGARKQFIKLGTGSDKRGRVNPSAGMARMTAAHRQTRARLEREIMQIDPHIRRRQQALINLLQLTELTLGALEDFVKRLLDREGQKALMGPRTRLVVAQQCGYYAGDLARIDYQPFRDTCLQTAADLREVQQLLTGRYDPVCKERILQLLTNCKNALTLKQAQTDVERTIFVATRWMRQRSRRFPIVREAKRLQWVHQVLTELDDSSFHQPVRARALTHLDHARQLCTLEGDAAGFIPALKEVLKECSAVL